MQNSEKKQYTPCKKTPNNPFGDITFTADATPQGESSQNSAPDSLTQQQAVLDEDSGQRENQEMPIGVLKVKPQEEFVGNLSKTKEKLKEANYNKFKKQFDKYKNLSKPLKVIAGIGITSIISGFICLLCRQDLACYVLFSSSLMTLWGPLLFSKFKIFMAGVKFLNSKEHVLESSLIINQQDKSPEMKLFSNSNIETGLEARLLDIKAETINADKFARPSVSEPNCEVAPSYGYRRVSHETGAGVVQY